MPGNTKRNRAKRQKRAERLKALKEAKGVNRAMRLPKGTTLLVEGSGKYDVFKAARGKNAAAKRSRALSKAVDIGGRSLGALGQAASGDYLGALMSGLKILGQGDYTLSRNSIVEDMTASQVPAMHSAKESIRFRHREFVCDVYSPNSTSAFVPQTYQINPGLTSLFPFLAPIAQQFQEYRFHGLAFEFKSIAAVALSSTNIGMGAVMMAAQYRANAPVFANKQIMMNEMWSVDGRPSDTFMLPIECDPAECPVSCLYVRGPGNLTSTVLTGDDAKFYDLAKFTIACQGIPVANQIIGELWITYDIELLKPLPTSMINQYGPGFLAPLSGYNPNANSLWPTVGFTGAQAPSYDTIGFQTAVPAAASVSLANQSTGYFYNNPLGAGSGVVFPLGTSGVYLISLFFNGTANTTSAAAPTVTNGSLVSWKSGPTGASNTTLLYNAYIHVNNPSLQCTVNFPTLTGPSALLASFVHILEVPYGALSVP